MVTKVYYNESGRITGAVVVRPENDEPGPSPIVKPYVVADTMPDLETAYVANGQIATRPASSATLTGATLTNLPQPCDIRLNGQTYRCEDGQANLSLPPGEYQVTVSAWPCLDANFTVRV